MAAPSPPRLSATWRVEAFFFSVALLRGGLFKLLSTCTEAYPPAIKSLIVKELLKPNAVRPYDTLSCCFHTALWFGKSQSILTQTQHSSESDMVCYRIFHVDSLTCSEVGPMSLEWPLAPRGGLVQSHHSMPQEDANGERPENAHFALPHLRWRRDALQPPEVQRDRLNRDTCAHIPDGGLRCVNWKTRGLIGSPASPQLSREKKHIYLTRLAKNNDALCLQEIRGKDEFLQAIQVLVPQFRLFGTSIPNNISAGGSAICIHKSLLPDGTIVTHVITC